MGTSLKLSDDVYWDTSSIVIKDGSNYYNFDDCRYELQCGYENLDDFTSTNSDSAAVLLARRKVVTFPRVFKTGAPYVFVSSAMDKNSWKYGITRYMSGTGNDTGTGAWVNDKFGIWAYNLTGNTTVIGNTDITSNQNNRVAWVALVPKTTPSAPANYTAGTFDYTPISTGTSVKLSDDLYWDMRAVGDAYEGGQMTLNNTYYDVDYGVYSMSVANDYTTGYDYAQVVTMNKTFKYPPVILCGMDDTSYNTGATRTSYTGNGTLTPSKISEIAVAAFATNKNGIGATTDGTTITWDPHHQFLVRAWNNTGATRTVKINWIAIGTVDQD